MYSPRKLNSVVRNRKEKQNSEMQKFEKEINNSLRVSCRENLNEYLIDSTLHGLRYVGDRTISRSERAFFACMFVLVSITSMYFISIVWIKWTRSPMIITLSPETLAVTDLPFPAVTVCSMNQVRKSAITFPEDSDEYTVVKGLCKMDLQLGNSSNTQADSCPLYDNISKQDQLVRYVEIENSLALCSTEVNDFSICSKDMLMYCEYGAIPFNCMDRFQTILTDDGLCCIFNGVHRRYLNKFTKKYFNPKLEKYPRKEQLPNLVPHRWTPEHGFVPKNAKNNWSGYPIAGFGPGNELGLTLYLKTDIDDYFCSSTRSYGFKMVLHSPNDPPRVSNFGTVIPNGYETRIVIMPTLSEAEDNVRRLSKKNCESECETKAVLENCDCIMYYMPRFFQKQTICGHAHYECVNNITRELSLRKKDQFKYSECLPGCYSVQYENTFSMSKIFDQAPYLLHYKLDPNNMAFVHTYYGRRSFRSQRKSELVGFTEFLSNLGGLLGLFMGFSVLSVIELFYFVSIRPYCIYLRLAKRRKELMLLFKSKVGSFPSDLKIPISTITSDLNTEKNSPRPYLE